MQTPLGSFLRVVALQVSIHDVPRLRTRQRVRGSLEQTPPVSPGRRQRNQIIKKHRRRHRVKIPTITVPSTTPKKKHRRYNRTQSNEYTVSIYRKSFSILDAVGARVSYISKPNKERPVAAEMAKAGWNDRGSGPRGRFRPILLARFSL